jgi:hypothetical protein
MVRFQQDGVLSREQEFVMTCIRQDHSSEEGIGAILNQPLNWEAVRRFALNQEVLPIMYHRLAEVAETRIPPDEWVQWKDRFKGNAYRNLRLAQKLIWIIGLLARNQITAVTLKGPVLAIQGYGDLSLRSFVDLDILTHPGNFHRVYEILTKAGFVPELQLTSVQQKWLVASDYHLPFIHQNDHIEIHWKIAEVGVHHPIKPDIFWQDLTVTHLLEEKINTLSPENTILLACLHGTKSGWNKLKWIADLANLIHAYPQTNWIQLVENAKSNGMYRLVCLGFLLAEEPGGTIIDDTIHEQIHKNVKAEKIAAQVRKRIWEKSPELDQLGFVHFYLESRERLRDRLYFILDQLFVPKQVDWVSLPLPRQFYFFYYLLRPLRLLVKFGPRIFAGLISRFRIFLSTETR